MIRPAIECTGPSLECAAGFCACSAPAARADGASLATTVLTFDFCSLHWQKEQLTTEYLGEKDDKARTAQEGVPCDVSFLRVRLRDTAKLTAAGIPD